jgi:hypothetical protein
VKLTSISSGLFGYNVNVSDFSNAFSGCKKLASIPSGLFSNNANATKLGGVFADCSLITSVPSGIFDGIADSGSKNIDLCFSGTAITSIDGNIFAHLTQLRQMFSVFYNTPLSSIPANLFASNMNLTSMDGVFRQTAITGIPESLLAACTQLQYATALFFECPNLTAIPNGLFDLNKNITRFDGIFYAVASLQGSTPSGSDGLKLWERAGQPGYPASIIGARCFFGCTGLSDYASIPSNWKNA